MFAGKPLENDVIMITGGGTGLGKSMAKAFGKFGAAVVITGRRAEKLDEAKKEIEAETGAQVLAVQTDVRDFDQVEKSITETVERFGKITGLVNNAAGNFLSPTEKLSPNGFRSVVEIVLFGSFHCTLAAGRQMIKQGQGGRILSIVTTYAWTGSALVIPSAAGKAGVLAMTRSLGVEWARHKILVNAIAPGPFPTPGAWERLMPPGMDEMAKNKIPLKRFGEHEELTNLATYLMSPYSSYITGECVTIDGGEWMMGGEFNGFMQMPSDSMEQMFDMMFAGRKKKKSDE